MSGNRSRDKGARTERAIAKLLADTPPTPGATTRPLMTFSRNPKNEPQLPANAFAVTFQVPSNLVRASATRRPIR